MPPPPSSTAVRRARTLPPPGRRVAIAACLAAALLSAASAPADPPGRETDRLLDQIRDLVDDEASLPGVLAEIKPELPIDDQLDRDGAPHRLPRRGPATRTIRATGACPPANPGPGQADPRVPRPAFLPATCPMRNNDSSFIAASRRSPSSPICDASGRIFATATARRPRRSSCCSSSRSFAFSPPPWMSRPSRSATTSSGSRGMAISSRWAADSRGSPSANPGRASRKCGGSSELSPPPGLP